MTMLTNGDSYVWSLELGSTLLIRGAALNADTYVSVLRDCVNKRPRPVALIRLTCCDGEDDIPAMHFCDMSR